MRFARLLSVEILVLGAACASFGGLVGVTVASTAYLFKSKDVAEELALTTARVRFLEGLVEESASFGTLEELASTRAIELVPDARMPPQSMESVAAEPKRTAPSVARTDSIVASPQGGSEPAPVPAQPAAQSASISPAPVARPPVPTAPAKTAPPVVAAVSQAKPVPAAPKPVHAPARASQSPARTVAASEKQSESAPAVAAPPAPPSATRATNPSSAAAVTAEEIRAAVGNGRVEGVAAQKAGVARLDAGLVQMASGRVIRVGERFPSGERLLQVDSTNNRLVTSERQILLFFQ